MQAPGGPKKLKKIRPLDLITHILGALVTCEMGLAKVYPCIKFEVSSFIHSKFTEGV